MRGFIFNIIGETSIEIKLTKNCIADCSHSGACDSEVASWVEKLKPQLNKVPAEIIAGVLKPYGAWDEEELKDSEQNLHRLIWCAASSCREEKSCWTTMEAF